MTYLGRTLRVGDTVCVDPFNSFYITNYVEEVFTCELILEVREPIVSTQELDGVKPADTLLPVVFYLPATLPEFLLGPSPILENYLHPVNEYSTSSFHILNSGRGGFYYPFFGCHCTVDADRNSYKTGEFSIRIEPAKVLEAKTERMTDVRLHEIVEKLIYTKRMFKTSFLCGRLERINCRAAVDGSFKRSFNSLNIDKHLGFKAYGLNSVDYFGEVLLEGGTWVELPMELLIKSIG
jgi:hypothetical protein